MPPPIPHPPFFFLPGSAETDARPRPSQKWGLVPAWVKSPDQNPHHTINCQKETLFTGTGMWAALRDKKRCVIIAQGFVCPKVWFAPR